MPSHARKPEITIIRPTITNTKPSAISIASPPLFFKCRGTALRTANWNIEIILHDLNSPRLLDRYFSSGSPGGRVGYAYFSGGRTIKFRWKGIDRNPIPDDWHRIGYRSSKVSDQSHPNRHATHPVNAMLNYAYTILESHVRQYVTAAGLDPSIGFLHGNYGDKLPLVYDLIEPLRPAVDRQILEFVQSNKFSPADFTLTCRGVCRLNPQLARNVVRIVDTNSGLADVVWKMCSDLDSGSRPLIRRNAS